MDTAKPSTWEALFGPYYFDATPMGPAGCRAYPYQAVALLLLGLPHTGRFLHWTGPPSLPLPMHPHKRVTGHHCQQCHLLPATQPTQFHPDH